MTLHWPQAIYIALTLIGLGVAFQQHGSPKTGQHNAWATLLASAIIISLLYWGGFFSK